MFPSLAVDLSPYQELRLSFGALYALGQDAASNEISTGAGSLQLVGLNSVPGCTGEELEALEEGRSTPACIGDQETALARGDWTAP